MPLYTPGRRRAIVLLLLTSVLLLTLDLRGNAVFDAVRTGFNAFMEPLESAADVATKPVVNAWRGITQWEDVREENDQLRDELAAMQADRIAAQAAIQEGQELRAERDLPSLGDYPRITAMVVGQSPSNVDQVVEINKGRDDSVEVGMAVIASGGLVGKVTRVLPDRAYVMLITDTRYATAATVIAGIPPTTTSTTAPPTTTDPNASSSSADASVPGSMPGSVAGSAPTDTVTDASVEVPTETQTTPPASAPAEPSSTAPADTSTTTTTIDMTMERDTGVLVGRGASSLPQVDLLGEAPSIGGIVTGDLVFTAGGDENLAPPGIPIGIVRNVIRRSPAAGPLLEVEPSADLDRLHFVDIIAYRSPSEADAVPEGSQAGG